MKKINTPPSPPHHHRPLQLHSVSDHQPPHQQTSACQASEVRGDTAQTVAQSVFTWLPTCTSTDFSVSGIRVPGWHSTVVAQKQVYLVTACQAFGVQGDSARLDAQKHVYLVANLHVNRLQHTRCLGSKVTQHGQLPKACLPGRQPACQQTSACQAFRFQGDTAQTAAQSVLTWSPTCTSTDFSMPGMGARMTWLRSTSFFSGMYFCICAA